MGSSANRKLLTVAAGKEREKVERDKARTLKWDFDEAIKENKAHLARIKELEGVNAILQSKTM